MSRDDSTRPADPSEILRELRQAVRGTVDEWLSQRCSTVSLAVTQVAEEAIARLQAAHAERIAEIEAAHQARVSELEREHREWLRSATRQRKSRMRDVERDLRETIERLEKNLMDASLEGIERLREVERRESQARLDLEHQYQQRLREKDDEIHRLRRGTTAGDALFDTLHDQLRTRRGPGGTDQH